MNETFIELFILLGCLILSGFFSATETAITTISSLKAKHLINSNKKSIGFAKYLLSVWMKKPQNIIASLLIANNLVNIFASIWFDGLMREKFGNLSPIIVTAIMTTLIVVFAEVIPKTMAKQFSLQVLFPLMSIFQLFYWILYPFTWIVSSVTHFITSRLHSNKAPSPQITEEELEFLIHYSEEEGVIEEQKHEMLSGIFELGDTSVREIMVHRTDITAVPSTMPVNDAIEVFRRTGLSRIPIYEDKIDNIIGLLHAKDVLFHLKDANGAMDSTVKVADVKREVTFVPETKPVDQLFQEMRRQKQHVVIVIDEYGGTSGLVSMEDVFEEIFGEVRDEFDNEEDAIRQTLLPNQYLVESKIHIDDFCDFFDIKTKDLFKHAIEASNEFDTLAGFIVHYLGRIPKVGEKLELEQIEIEIAELSRRRVRKVLVRTPGPLKQRKSVNKQD